MSIFDIFTFKKEATKIFSKENFAHILEVARLEIIEQAKKNIPGVEKKFIVDEKVLAQLGILKDSCKNKLLMWLIDRVMDAIPTVTQLIYNFLKEKIENL